MTRYNYKEASKLFDEYYDLVCNPWDFCGDEKRFERRNFMRAITRKIGFEELYIDHLNEMIEESKPIEDAKSRCFDFEYERTIESLIDKIKNFRGKLSPKYRVEFTCKNGKKWLSGNIYDEKIYADYYGDERCLEYDHNMRKNPDIGTPYECVSYKIIEVWQ